MGSFDVNATYTNSLTLDSFRNMMSTKSDGKNKGYLRLTVEGGKYKLETICNQNYYAPHVHNLSQAHNDKLRGLFMQSLYSSVGYQDPTAQQNGVSLQDRPVEMYIGKLMREIYYGEADSTKQAGRGVDETKGEVGFFRSWVRGRVKRTTIGDAINRFDNKFNTATGRKEIIGEMFRAASEKAGLKGREGSVELKQAQRTAFGVCVDDVCNALSQGEASVQVENLGQDVSVLHTFAKFAAALNGLQGDRKCLSEQDLANGENDKDYLARMRTTEAAFRAMIEDVSKLLTSEAIDRQQTKKSEIHVVKLIDANMGKRDGILGKLTDEGKGEVRRLLEDRFKEMRIALHDSYFKDANNRQGTCQFDIDLSKVLAEIQDFDTLDKNKAFVEIVKKLVPLVREHNEYINNIEDKIEQKIEKVQAEVNVNVAETKEKIGNANVSENSKEEAQQFIESNKEVVKSNLVEEIASKKIDSHVNLPDEKEKDERKLGDIMRGIEDEYLALVEDANRCFTSKMDFIFGKEGENSPLKKLANEVNGYVEKLFDGDDEKPAWYGQCAKGVGDVMLKMLKTALVKCTVPNAIFNEFVKAENGWGREIVNGPNTVKGFVNAVANNFGQLFGFVSSVENLEEFCKDESYATFKGSVSENLLGIDKNGFKEVQNAARKFVDICKSIQKGAKPFEACKGDEAKQKSMLEIAKGLLQQSVVGTLHRYLSESPFMKKGEALKLLGEGIKSVCEQMDEQGYALKLQSLSAADAKNVETLRKNLTTVSQEKNGDNALIGIFQANDSGISTDELQSFKVNAYGKLFLKAALSVIKGNGKLTGDKLTGAIQDAFNKEVDAAFATIKTRHDKVVNGVSEKVKGKWLDAELNTHLGNRKDWPSQLIQKVRARIKGDVIEFLKPKLERALADVTGKFGKDEIGIDKFVDDFLAKNANGALLYAIGDHTVVGTTMVRDVYDNGQVLEAIAAKVQKVDVSVSDAEAEAIAFMCMQQVSIEQRDSYFLFGDHDEANRNEAFVTFAEGKIAGNIQSFLDYRKTLDESQFIRDNFKGETKTLHDALASAFAQAIKGGNTFDYDKFMLGIQGNYRNGVDGLNRVLGQISIVEGFGDGIWNVQPGSSGSETNGFDFVMKRSVGVAGNFVKSPFASLISKTLEGIGSDMQKDLNGKALLAFQNDGSWCYGSVSRDKLVGAVETAFGKGNLAERMNATIGAMKKVLASYRDDFFNSEFPDPANGREDEKKLAAEMRNYAFRNYWNGRDGLPQSAKDAFSRLAAGEIDVSKFESELKTAMDAWRTEVGGKVREAFERQKSELVIKQKKEKVANALDIGDGHLGNIFSGYTEEPAYEKFKKQIIGFADDKNLKTPEDVERAIQPVLEEAKKVVADIRERYSSKNVEESKDIVVKRIATRTGKMLMDRFGFAYFGMKSPVPEGETLPDYFKDYLEEYIRNDGKSLGINLDVNAYLAEDENNKTYPIIYSGKSFDSDRYDYSGTKVDAPRGFPFSSEAVLDGYRSSTLLSNFTDNKKLPKCVATAIGDYNFRLVTEYKLVAADYLAPTKEAKLSAMLDDHLEAADKYAEDKSVSIPRNKGVMSSHYGNASNSLNTLERMSVLIASDGAFANEFSKEMTDLFGVKGQKNTSHGDQSVLVGKVKTLVLEPLTKKFRQLVAQKRDQLLEGCLKPKGQRTALKSINNAKLRQAYETLHDYAAALQEELMAGLGKVIDTLVSSSRKAKDPFNAGIARVLSDIDAVISSNFGEPGSEVRKEFYAGKPITWYDMEPRVKVKAFDLILNDPYQNASALISSSLDASVVTMQDGNSMIDLSKVFFGEGSIFKNMIVNLDQQAMADLTDDIKAFKNKKVND